MFAGQSATNIFLGKSYFRRIDDQNSYSVRAMDILVQTNLFGKSGYTGHVNIL